MEKLIGIRTKRYSEFFRRLLQEYSDAALVIDGHRFSPSEIPQVIESWCTNSRIRSTREFELSRGGVAIAGFHDSPDETWLIALELPFVERLASEKIVRYDTPVS